MHGVALLRPLPSNGAAHMPRGGAAGVAAAPRTPAAAAAAERSPAQSRARTACRALTRGCANAAGASSVAAIFRLCFAIVLLRAACERCRDERLLLAARAWLAHPAAAAADAAAQAAKCWLLAATVAHGAAAACRHFVRVLEFAAAARTTRHRAPPFDTTRNETDDTCASLTLQARSGARVAALRLWLHTLKPLLSHRRR